jgi:uncharacterized protein YndB with AHSA1/START domain
MNGSNQQPIVVERTYQASLEELWALWTTKAGFESWWGPEAFRVEVHRMEARAGGRIDYDMIADTQEAVAAMERINQPTVHATHGWFDEFRPCERLALRHNIDFIQGVAPYEHLIEVAFEPLGDMARMAVTIHPHADPHWTRMALEGFRSQLTKLDTRFAAAT